MTYFVSLLIGILTLIGCFIAFFKWKYSYWRNRNIPYIKPHIPFGTLENPFTRKYNPILVMLRQYQYLKSSGLKCGGLFLFVKPSLLVVDVELIKNILAKDFQYFTDRDVAYDEKANPLSANLFNLEGYKWRPLRVKLSPTFTSGKMKMMFSLITACGDPMVAAVNDLVQRKDPVDIKDVLARFTTDVIGSCVFGLDCNSFKEPESDFRKYGKMIFSVTSMFQVVKTTISLMNPKLSSKFGIGLVPAEPKKFFMNVVKETVAFRKANNVVRNDFVHLLMNLAKEDGSGEGLTIEQMAAQAFNFWFAGFETSSTTMTFSLYELSLNQEMQDKARKEINTILKENNDNLTYDAIKEMKYLSQVLDETLRKYAPGPMLTRQCVKDYQVPQSDLTLQKGMRIAIPVYALHHDSEYFPNPEKFDPDRFSDGNRSNIRPFTYMPFGEGPRNCIGLRFGLLQSKVGLAVLLKNFRFSINRKTEPPLKLDRFPIIISAKGGTWMDVEKIP